MKKTIKRVVEEEVEVCDRCMEKPAVAKITMTRSQITESLVPQGTTEMCACLPCMEIIWNSRYQRQRKKGSKDGQPASATA